MAPTRARASGVSSNPSSASTSLPVYQSPAHPLNEKAQQALRNLPQSHKLAPLEQRLKLANECLTSSATEIIDCLQVRIRNHTRKKARRDAQGLEVEEEEKQVLNEMRRATDQMTGKLEVRIRQNIDTSEAVKRMEGALKDLDANIAASRGATQSTLGASQFRSGPLYNDADAEDGLALDSTTFDQNELSDLGASQPPKSAFNTLKQRVKDEHTAYQTLSMTDRYASHNDYIHFRKMVHDARYPSEEAPPLPHPSTWFPSDALGAQNSSEHALPGSQRAPPDDDDVAIATERISVKCPITLTEMRDPVSSTKCPHNFERSAILDMISLSTDRLDGDEPGRRGEKAMRCPQAGCDVMLAASDLHTNPVLVRKIKRAQAALARHTDDDIEDRDIDDDDDDAITNPHRRKKKQPFSEAISSSPAAAPLPSRIKSERRSLASRSASVVPETQLAADTGAHGMMMPPPLPPPSTAGEVIDLEDEA